MARISPGRSPKQRGGAMLEVSVIMPLLVLGLVGGVDFGRAWQQTQSLAHAADSGARFGAQTTDLAEEHERIREIVFRDLNLSEEDEETVTVIVDSYCECSNGSRIDCGDDCSTGDTQPMNYVFVGATREFAPLLPYPGLPEIIELRHDAYVRAD